MYIIQYQIWNGGKTQMKNEANQTKYNEQRKLYMDGKITHKEFYLWLASFIGATKAQLPVSQERIDRSKDEHLNDIPLKLWDNQDYIIRPMAYAKGIAWSLSDTVCTLKTLAR
jgi:hypothetical protein